MGKRLARVLFVVFIVLFYLMKLARETEQPEEQIEIADQLYCDEYFEDDSLLLPGGVRKHYRSWNKYSYDSVYCLNYAISNSEVAQSRNLRQLIKPKGRGYGEYWRDVYFELYRNNATSLRFIEDSLQFLARRYKLSRSDLARMAVSFIQDIPYQYVMPGPCNVYDHPCVPNERFGILTPKEFLFTLSGDCDTRSVLLFTVLQNLGFHPIIVISNQYRHAMIAVDVPSTGDFINHRGSRFYFWETTNTGWQPGMLPPDTNNISYWEIALDYEYANITSGAD